MELVIGPDVGISYLTEKASSVSSIPLSLYNPYAAGMVANMGNIK